VGAFTGIVLSLPLGAVFLVAESAVADNMAGATGQAGCYVTDNIRADNDDHTFAYFDLGTRVESKSNLVRTEKINPTNVETRMADDPANADVQVRDYDYVSYCGFDWWDGTSGVVGLAECEVGNANMRCQTYDVRFDSQFTSAATADEIESLVCHEFGHTLGLRHRDAGCIESGQVSQLNYTDHDRTHINNSYSAN
jgi:hypothetical protein